MIAPSRGGRKGQASHVTRMTKSLKMSAFRAVFPKKSVVDTRIRERISQQCPSSAKGVPWCTAISGTVD
jgi:hypothetical protein